MDCTSFRENVLTHIDGELSGAERASADAHESECASCAELANAERAFEERSRSALLAGVEQGAFASILAAARARAAPRPDGRLVPLRRRARMLAAIAALAFVSVTAMWSLCIPPFECAYLVAMESAATVDAGSELPAAAARTGLLARVRPPAKLADFARTGEADVVSVEYRSGVRALRARYERGGESFTVIWSDLIGSAPSFRRHIERDGMDWWIADENGRNVVTYICPETDTLCALVGTLPEARLREIAMTLRCK